MPINATHFVEVVKVDNVTIRHFLPQPIRLLQWSAEVNKKHGLDMIAVFKIAPKVKPVIATYDYDLKTTIVEDAR